MNAPIFQHKMIFFFAIMVGKFFQDKEVNFYVLLAQSFQTIMNTS